MTHLVRPVVPADVPTMVALSEEKRTEYARQQPVFWRVADDSIEKQHDYFTRLIADDRTLTFVFDEGAAIHGFIIGVIVAAPPVYDPGGLICIVDDFTVVKPEMWQHIGDALLTAVRDAARAYGAVQIIVVCGHHDAPKQAFLTSTDCRIASEWWVGTL